MCLENVDDCDVFILLLDKRYGPAIPSYGKKSATHLEYDRAIAMGIPIITFARRDMLNDHRVWQMLKKKGTPHKEISNAIIYVDKSHHRGNYEFNSLFAFFDEVRRATSPQKTNWYDSFDNVYELKSILKKRVKEVVFNEENKMKRLIVTAASAKDGLWN
jgi:hypothetical protein